MRAVGPIYKSGEHAISVRWWGEAGWKGGGRQSCLSRLYSSNAPHLLRLADIGEDKSVASDPPAHPGDANVTPARLWGPQTRLSQPRATLNRVPLRPCVKSQRACRQSNRLNMTWGLLLGDYKVSHSDSRNRSQK